MHRAPEEASGWYARLLKAVGTMDRDPVEELYERVAALERTVAGLTEGEGRGSVDNGTDRRL